ncbi:MAG: TMEM175 family protein [Bacteroidota bacterium]
MLSKKFKRSQKISKTGFRYRGLAASRLENLTDAVFGFSITLLVIASEVPRDYVELQASMYGFSGFIFCILLLLSIWNNQNNFFLRYGLQDQATKILTFLFLFLLLFYIYPLKYLFSYLGTAIYAQIMIGFGDKSEALIMAVDKLNESALTTAEWKDIMIRFGLGLFLIYGLLALMHVHALRKKEELELNELEEFETGTTIRSYIVLMAIAFSSILVVVIFGGYGASYAGAIYGTIPLFLILLKKRRKKKFKRLSTEDD